MSTRRLQATDSNATMAFYSSLVYLAAALVLVPIILTVGEIPHAHPSIAFLFHPWTIPTLLTLAGAGLTLLSGLFILYLDRQTRQSTTDPAADQ